MNEAKEYGEALFENRMAEREAKEKLEEEEKAKKLAEATKDETDPRKWSVETTVQYFMWILQTKNPNEIEEIISTLIDKIKG